MLNELLNRNKKVAVLGLGYVGLPLALRFAKFFDVIGYDINKVRITELQGGIDTTEETNQVNFANSSIDFTSSENELVNANFYLVSVPTGINEQNEPDLSSLIDATQTVAKCLKKDDIVVFESTVYPGCTESICLPILEKTSGLKLGADFKLGYSPERINPGDREHAIDKVIKVISGSDNETLLELEKIYGTVLNDKLFKAASIQVAEASKILENAQRDLNIALINEMSIIFNLMDINTYDVLDAAATKWNFNKFTPGLVGGHCIGVDPYYLTYKAKLLGYESKVVQAGRLTNDEMHKHAGNKVLNFISQNRSNEKELKILILGVTFKENVKDTRNSKVINLYNYLLSSVSAIDVIDPVANAEELESNYEIKLTSEPIGQYDVIILAVPHQEFLSFSEDFFKKHLKEDGLFFDLKGIYRVKMMARNYSTL